MSSGPESRDNSPSTPGPEPAPQGQAQVPSSAARVWAQFRDLIFERMATVEAAVSGYEAGSVDARISGRKPCWRRTGWRGRWACSAWPRGRGWRARSSICWTRSAALAPDTPRRLAELAAGLRRELEKGPA